MDFLKDMWGMLKTRKNFWLLPAIIILRGVGIAIVAAGSSIVAPFIYTIF